MISFKKTMSLDEKITFIEALTYILSIGGKETTLRQEYILRQSFECDLETKELKMVKKLKKADDLIKKLKAIMNNKTKRFILREMILLAVIDHEITDSEMCQIYEIGCGAGIKQEKINDFFLWAAKGVEWQMEGANLVEADF